MKKAIVMILSLCMILVGNMTSLAANIIGYSTYTDVVTYINHYPIPSYNFKGTTLIAAEDLKNYGFDVFWNEYKWSLSINRNQETKVSPFITFKPSKSKLGKKELSITKTNVSVCTENYQYTAFGGLDGKTLINIEDLRCINGVSVVWVPEIKAMKVWVDGLNVKETPAEVREWHDFNYYDSCQGLNTWFYWEWVDTKDVFILSLAEMASRYSPNYVNCYGTITITDVINSDGQSILKRKISRSENASIAPYVMWYTNYMMARSIVLNKDDLNENNAIDKGGLVKFSYSCGGSFVSDTIRVNILPH